MRSHSQSQKENKYVSHSHEDPSLMCVREHVSIEQHKEEQERQNIRV